MPTSVQKTLKLTDRSVICIITRKNVIRLRMRIKPDLKVCISAPMGVSDAVIERFILKNTAFIRKAIVDLEAKKAQAPAPTGFVDGEKISVFGKIRTLRVLVGKRNSCTMMGEYVFLTVKDPSDIKLKTKTFDKFAHSAVEQLISYMCERYYKCFSDYTKGYPQIKFKNMTSRWGSCTPLKNTLTFNYALFSASEYAVEYVVVHEYSHFVEQNHSKRFYAVVERLLPDYKQRRNELKKAVI